MQRRDRGVQPVETETSQVAAGVDLLQASGAKWLGADNHNRHLRQGVAELRRRRQNLALLRART